VKKNFLVAISDIVSLLYNFAAERLKYAVNEILNYAYYQIPQKYFRVRKKGCRRFSCTLACRSTSTSGASVSGTKPWLEPQAYSLHHNRSKKKGKLFSFNLCTVRSDRPAALMISMIAILLRYKTEPLKTLYLSSEAGQNQSFLLAGRCSWYFDSIPLTGGLITNIE